MSGAEASKPLVPHAATLEYTSFLLDSTSRAEVRERESDGLFWSQCERCPDRGNVLLIVMPRGLSARLISARAAMQHPHCALSHRLQSLAEAVTALIPCARLYHWFAFELQETVAASGHPYAGALDEGRVHA